MVWLSPSKVPLHCKLEDGAIGTQVTTDGEHTELMSMSAVSLPQASLCFVAVSPPAGV